MGDFACPCGRRQTDSIGEAMAERMGWRKINGEWHCPFCTGNEDSLRRLFMEGSEPCDES